MAAMSLRRSDHALGAFCRRLASHRQGQGDYGHRPQACASRVPHASGPHPPSRALRDRLTAHHTAKFDDFRRFWAISDDFERFLEAASGSRFRASKIDEFRRFSSIFEAHLELAPPSAKIIQNRRKPPQNGPKSPNSGFCTAPLPTTGDCSGRLGVYRRVSTKRSTRAPDRQLRVWARGLDSSKGASGKPGCAPPWAGALRRLHLQAGVPPRQLNPSHPSPRQRPR